MNTLYDMAAAVALILLGASCYAIALSVRSDRAAAARVAAETAERHKAMEQIQALYHTKFALHCLSCGETFPGPLVAAVGCPKCGIGSLIVSDDEYRNMQQPDGER